MLRYLILGLFLCWPSWDRLAACRMHGSARSRFEACAPVPLPTTRARQGEACTEGCRRQHSACLIRDKGSPDCNSQLQRCLQNCLAGKRK